MNNIITRKCAKCKGVIEINVDDIRGIVYFDKKFYHKDCFIETATKKAANKRSSLSWQEALNDGLRQISKDAKYNIDYCYGRDLLFEHLLHNYDICAISSYANMLISNVVSGKYKGKSKPILYRDFAECWIGVQSDLDNIYANNQRLGKNMTGDQRIVYDIAVVVRTYPEWKRKQEHKKKKAENRNVAEQHKINIDYAKIKTNEKNSGLGDISDLLDEI
jgi:hypothetical protein